MWMFFTITKTIIDAFLSGSACAVSVYTGKTAIQKRIRSNDKNSKN